jgi:hypothetical protein
MATTHFASNAVNVGATSATTISDTLPAGLTNGDVLVCVVSSERTTAIPGTPTGLANTWSVINTSSNTDGSWFLGFVALTAADSSVTFTSTVSLARRMAMGWSIVRGGDSTAVTSALGTYTANGNGVLTAVAPSITPAVNDSMLVSIWANTDSVTPYSRTQTIAGTGFTQRFFDQSTSTISGNALVGGGTRQIAAGGGSSQTGGTLTDSSTKFNWIAATVAVPPLPLGASPNAQPMNVGVAMVFDPSGGSIGLELSLVGALAVGTVMAGSTTSGAGAVAPTPGPVGDGPVFCRVDWNQDGNFNSIGDDVTTRVRGAITAQYGRDQDTSLQQIVAGRGAIVLDNRSRDYCLEEDAEALVYGRGWQRHDQLKPGDAVLIYDPDDDVILWEPLTEVVRLPWDGSLTRWRSTSIDVATTPHHQWWTVGTSGKGHYAPRFRTTEDITGKQVKVMIGGGQPECFATDAELDHDFVELLAWVFTEGWFESKDLIGDRSCVQCDVRPARGARGPAVCEQCARAPFSGRPRIGPRPTVYTRTGFAQSQTAKPKQVARIRELVDRLVAAGHPISEHQYRTGDGVMSAWRFSGELDRQVRAALPDKRLTPKLLCSFTCEQAEIFLDVLIAADGHVSADGGREFYQKDRDQLALVAMLCAMLGIRTAVKPGTNDLLVGTLTLGKRNRLAASSVHAATEPYRGIVWCPRVRTGIFLARCHGKTFWTGNSPRNQDSPLYPLVKPNRPVLVERKVGSTVYTLFRAHTDDSPINPDIDSKTVAVGLVDYLADLKGQTIATGLSQGIRTGAAVGLVLDAIGWTGGRDLDVGATIMPWWWEDGTDALEALQKIVASEGQPAFLSIGPVGEFVFRDRHHRLTRAASTTSQSTWRGSGPVEPVMGTGFSYDAAWSNTVNDVSFSVTERSPDPRQSWVWTTDETLNLAALESRVVVISTSEPFYQARAPVVSSDYFVQSGSITSTSISRTSGASTSVTLTAGASGAVVTGLQLRARSVPVGRTRVASARDATSIADYGSRGLPSGLEPVWAGYWDAQDIADLLVLQRSQPLPVLRVQFSCPTGADAKLAALLARDLSDRVTVVEPETATNGPFFVESIGHVVAWKGDHVITFGLEAVPSQPSTVPFILGTSTLGGTDVLQL